MSLEFLGSLGFLGFLGALGGLGVIASCTSHTGEAEMEPAAIGFHTHRIEEVGTRALISTTDDLRTLGFGVYGDKTVGTSSPSPQLVFDNIKVSGSPWDYKPTKYWDRTATYRFVAYAPWTASGTSYDAASKQLTINGIPQWKKINGNEIDYLVATSAGTATEYLQTPTPNGTVNLEFKHIYAQLLISVAKTMSSGTTTYKITGMRMASGVTDDIPTAQTCTYQYDAKTASNCKITSTRTFTNSFSFLDNLSDADDVTVSAEATPLAHFLVAPFTTTNNLKLYLDYTITEGVNTTNVEDVEVDLENKEFKSNNKYTYVLRFQTGKPVALSVVEVKQWDQVKVTDEVYNW